MLQVGAAGHHLKHRLVGDVVAAGHLQAAQFRAALRQHVQRPVRQPLAAVHHHRLQGQAHVGRVLTQPVGQDPDGPVDVEQLPRQPDGGPQPGVPGQVVPAAAHSGASAQLIGGEVGEDLQQGVVGEDVDGGVVVVGFGLAGARVGAGLRVDHGDGFRGRRRGGRGVGLMAVTGEGGRGQRGGLGRQNETRAGGAEGPSAGV